MATLCAAESSAPKARLDLHEGIGDPRRFDDPLAGGCQRWPEELRLLNTSTGELIAGRCKATNLCRYCQTLYVVETVEMLTLDAIEHAPTLWLVLTAREHLTRAECRNHLRQLRKAVRARWAAAEWFVQVEFQRRGALHLNLLVKGVPVDELQELHELVTERWCARVDALPVGQWSGAIEDGVGCVRYIAKMLAHGLKREQAPPIGWRGHRTSQTRGYLVRPASTMREEARRSLRLKRLLHRGVDLETAEHELQAAELVVWELRHVRPSSIVLRADRSRVTRAPVDSDRLPPSPAPPFAGGIPGAVPAPSAAKRCGAGVSRVARRESALGDVSPFAVSPADEWAVRDRPPPRALARSSQGSGDVSPVTAGVGDRVDELDGSRRCAHVDELAECVPRRQPG